MQGNQGSSFLLKAWIDGVEYDILPEQLNIEDLIDFDGQRKNRINIKGTIIVKPSIPIINIPVEIFPTNIETQEPKHPVIESRDW